MKWNKLSDLHQLEALTAASASQPVLIFKHSTRCSISSTALDRVERAWNEAEVHDTQAYYLDLIQFRDVSGAIAQKFGVEHQSPQVLIIKDGACVYDASHYDIRYQEILKHL